MLRSIIFVTATLTAAFASAADLPRPVKSPPPAIAQYDWSGFYVGANVGYAFNSQKFTTTGTPAFQTLIAPGFVPGSLTTTFGGILGGGQIGYNFQKGLIVGGIEADWQLANLRERESFTGGAVLGTRLNTSVSNRLDSLGTVRGRIGVALTQQWIAYATGGLAFGQVRIGAQVAGVDAPALVWTGETNATKTGYVVGAGSEFALTENLSLKAEYLYYNLGNSSVSALGNAAVRGVAALDGIDYVARTTNAGNIVRAGVNYRF
jgi:outer membrane immunogenic protein